MNSPKYSKALALLMFALVLAACDKDRDGDACRDNKVQVEISVSSFGQVLHPVPDNILFTQSEILIQPENSNNSIQTRFRDIEISVDDMSFFPPDSLPYIILDSLNLGTHSVDVTLSCSKDDGFGTCECEGNETYASRSIEIVKPAHVMFDTLYFSQSLGCNWDFPGNGCPELDFDFDYYDSELVVPIADNYNISNGPFIYAMQDTIAIYPSTCSIGLKLSDWDQLGNAEDIDQWTLEGTTMGNWQTGTYELEPGMSISIIRLD